LSALTKLFVVLLVVCSLLLSGAVAVFVNRVEDWRKANEVTKQTNVELSAQRDQWRVEAAAEKSRRTDSENRLESAQRALADTKDSLIREKADRDKEVEALRKQQLVAEQRVKEAGEQVSAALKRADAADARVDDLIKDKTQLITAVGKHVADIADLVRQVEILKRDSRSNEELVAQLQMQLRAAQEIITNNRLTIDASAPPIDLKLNGTVSAVKADGGQFYATITLGANDRVREGMSFMVMSRETTPKYLATFIVDKVDTQESFGHLEGPRPQDVKADCAVVFDSGISRAKTRG